MTIELSGHKVQQLMDKLDDEERVIFEKILLTAASVEPLRYIKNWVSNFESDCPVDNLIARFVQQIIQNLGIKINEDMLEKKVNGIEKYNGHLAAVIAVKTVREIADTFEKHLNANCADKCEIH